MGNYQDIHIEQDFWDDFIVEAFEHLEDIENNAMSLEQNPEDMEIIHTMFRAFHTIKGLSGFVEHTVVQEVAHKTETLMDFCRKGELKVNTKIIDAILKSSDYIKRLCEDINAYKDEALINQIEALLVVLENLAEVESAPASTEKEIQAEVPDSTVQELQAEIISEESLSPEKGLEALANEVFEIEEEPEKAKETETKVKKKASKSKSEDKIIENKELSIEAEALKSFQNSVIEKLKGTVKSEETVEVKSEVTVESTSKPTASIESEITVEIKDEIKSDIHSPQIEQVKEAAVVKATSASEEYMKVANHKIDHLVEMMGELIINQALMEQYVSSTYLEDKQLTANMSGFLRISRELQYLSMSLRMVSLKSTFQKLTRIARDTIQELGKNVEFVTSGENTEIDRVVADKLLDPLVHMIKNAISHGIEKDSDARIKSNKNPRARVELNVYSKRGKIFIEVKDDGRGIDTEVVYKKALEKGLIDPNKTYSDAEIKEFIMLPGFSTAEVIDNISGRGVGMDVVKTQILKTGGKVDIQSTLGKGSIFTLEVPVNHAIMNGTIIEINKQHFVVPTLNVKEFLQPSKEQWIFTKQERTMIRVRDNIIPIVPPSVFFKDLKTEEHVPLVMLLELDQELRAVPITNVINRQEVVVKPVGEEFSDLKYISGMSILGTGKVSLILDIDYLFRKEIKE